MIEPRATARKRHVQDQVGRSDPRYRTREPVDGQVRIKNGDPSKFYVIVSRAQVDEYLDRGYQIVFVEEGGPSLNSGRESKPGEPVTWRKDSILMQIDAEERKRIELEGDGGGGLGQVWADELMESIVDFDEFKRSFGGSRYLQVGTDDKHTGIQQYQES